MGSIVSATEKPAFKSSYTGFKSADFDGGKVNVAKSLSFVSSVGSSKAAEEENVEEKVYKKGVTFEVDETPMQKQQNMHRRVTKFVEPPKKDAKKNYDPFNLGGKEGKTKTEFAKRVTRLMPNMAMIEEDFGDDDDEDGANSNDEHPFRYYQKIFIQGQNKEFDTGEYIDISKKLVNAMRTRAHYMKTSVQMFPHHIEEVLPGNDSDQPIYYELPHGTGSGDMEGYETVIKEGVIDVLHNARSIGLPCIDREQFLNDRNLLFEMMTDGMTKTYCYHRMDYLKHKFRLHIMLNEQLEGDSLKQANFKHKRDFFNVRKVDTHIHAAACMSPKHMLEFIIKKYNTEGNRVVLNKNGESLTLRQVFKKLKLDPRSLNIDSLNMHATKTAFHRFDIFNSMYNPAKAAELREIFLKTDNYVKGEYFGEIIKEVNDQLVKDKYYFLELRISIYGCRDTELEKLAEWFDHCKLEKCYHLKWVIQVPRIYNIFRKFNPKLTFGKLLHNIFKDFFEATLFPEKHKKIHNFLKHLVGFDSVDDESKPEVGFFRKSSPTPDKWDKCVNPPYMYYLYYMWANIAKLNQLRRARGMNVFTLRPHCGEAGHQDHILAGFMLAENISHGLTLKTIPTMQYLYYLTEMAINMSPLSNNQLFLRYNKNPFPTFFAQGLNINLSTDDPLLFHYTQEPLMEEYAIAAQVWNFSCVDLSEIARNSVHASGFPHEYKLEWLGENYHKEGLKGNNVQKSNVPDIRVLYRKETRDCEIFLLLNCLLQATASETKGFLK